MKRVSIMLLGLILFVSACGDNDAATEDPDIKQQESIETIEDENLSDPLEIGNKNNDVTTFEHDWETYEIVSWYSNKDTNEDGFNRVDFEGNLFVFSLALVEDGEGNQYIGMFGEVENQTDKHTQINTDMELLTDQGDQVRIDGYFGDTKPGAKKKGIGLAELEYGKPNSFEVEIEAPYDLTEDEYLPEAGLFGDNITMEFYLE